MKNFELGGKHIVTAHITSFWVEASDTVCVQLSSGETINHPCKSEEVEIIIQNLISATSNNVHT